MAARPRTRAASVAALCVSLALNVAFLASMAFGLRALPSPPETRAVELTLLPPLLRSPPAPKAPRPGARAGPVLKVLTRPPEPRSAPGVPSAPAAVPTVIAPPAKAPAAPQGDGLEATLKETVGCDDPDAFHLTPAQRAVCDARFMAHAKGGSALGLNIAPDKLAAYDRYVRCHEAQHGGALPAPDDSTDGVTGIKGLGEIPRLRDCGPGDR